VSLIKICQISFPNQSTTINFKAKASSTKLQKKRSKKKIIIRLAIPIKRLYKTDQLNEFTSTLIRI